jgi:probable F420-dependent oxidoreductase
MAVTVSLQLAPQYGDMARMRDAWVEAEALGVDRLYTCDHFHAMVVTTEVMHGAHAEVPQSGKNFEATTVQAAMAATTTRAEIGCIVHGNSYRNPNLMADIARTIDHISGGRYILGMGSGYLKPDYDAYGYDYGNQATRLHDLARALPIIKSRFEKLNPPPLRKIPLLIASAGEKIGLKIVAEHADIWHAYGARPELARKTEILERYCRDIGRDPREIEFATHYLPGDMVPDADPDAYIAMGFEHINLVNFGPDWDLGALRELLAWKKNLGARAQQNIRKAA